MAGPQVPHTAHTAAQGEYLVAYIAARAPGINRATSGTVDRHAVESSQRAVKEQPLCIMARSRHDDRLGRRRDPSVRADGRVRAIVAFSSLTEPWPSVRRLSRWCASPGSRDTVDLGRAPSPAPPLAPRALAQADRGAWAALLDGLPSGGNNCADAHDVLMEGS